MHFDENFAGMKDERSSKRCCLAVLLTLLFMPVFLFLFPIAVMQYVEHLGFVLVSCLLGSTPVPLPGVPLSLSVSLGILGTMLQVLHLLLRTLYVSGAHSAQWADAISRFTLALCLDGLLPLQGSPPPPISGISTKVACLRGLLELTTSSYFSCLGGATSSYSSCLGGLRRIKVLLRDTLLRLPV